MPAVKNGGMPDPRDEGRAGFGGKLFGQFLLRILELDELDLDQLMLLEKLVDGGDESRGEPVLPELYHGVETLGGGAQLFLLFAGKFH